MSSRVSHSLEPCGACQVGDMTVEVLDRDYNFI